MRSPRNAVSYSHGPAKGNTGVPEGDRMFSTDTSKWWLANLITLIVFSVCLNAEGQDGGGAPTPQQCQVRAVSTPALDFPVIKDWKPVRLESPTAQLIIRDDGSVKNVRLIRSSNVRQWDQVFLNAVKKWQFSKAPTL